MIKITMILIVVLVSSLFWVNTHIVYGMSRVPKKGSTIRILLNLPDGPIRIKGTDLLFYNAQGDIFKCQDATITYKDTNLFINQHDTHAKELFVRSKDQIFFVGKNAYRGELKVLRNKDDLFELINIVSIEDYLISVVGGEFSSKSKIELLKAQAIAARTFALYHINERKKHNFDLKKNAMAYKGISSENKSSKLAVESTDGIVMTYRGKIFPSFFHASCGGYTIEYHEVFSGRANCPGKVKCIPCLKRAPHPWNYKMDLNALKNLLNKHQYPVVNTRKIQVERNPQTERVNAVIIDGVRIPAHELRHIVGHNHIKSTIFWIKAGFRNILFKGKAWGHGIGLCQYGAEALASKGWDDKKILSVYYRGINLKKI